MLNDIWNFLIIITGTFLSLFTLFYSFILSKKDQLKDIALEIKIGSNDPLLVKKQTNIKNYITKLTSLNRHIYRVIKFSFFLGLAGWFLERFVMDYFTASYKTLCICFSILALCLLIYAVYIIKLIIADYFKVVRLE